MGICIFTKSVDTTMTKLALEAIAEEKTNFAKLKNAVRATEVTKWYTQKNQSKSYSKAAVAHKDKHCSKCDSRAKT